MANLNPEERKNLVEVLDVFLKRETADYTRKSSELSSSGDLLGLKNTMDEYARELDSLYDFLMISATAVRKAKEGILSRANTIIKGYFEKKFNAKGLST